MDGIQSKSESARERENHEYTKTQGRERERERERKRERENQVEREKEREVKQQRVGSNVASPWSGGFDRWPWRKPRDRVRLVDAGVCQRMEAGGRWCLNSRAPALNSLAPALNRHAPAMRPRRWIRKAGREPT